MKYLLYRFPDALKWDDEDEPRLKKGFHFPIQPELVSVEYGEDIDQAA